MSEEYSIARLLGGPISTKWRQLPLLPVEIRSAMKATHARDISAVDSESAAFRGILAGLALLVVHWLIFGFEWVGGHGLLLIQIGFFHIICLAILGLIVILESQNPILFSILPNLFIRMSLHSGDP
jgi:hypothetical protein